MKTERRQLWAVVILITAVNAPLFAAENPPSWSASAGFGVVDQDAIGGAPTISVELELRLIPSLSLGLRSGYFTKEGCCGEERDTLYGVCFGRARWPRDGVQPFVEAGRGNYVIEGDTEHGWFGGIGIEIPFTGNRGGLLSARYHSVTRPRQGPLPDFSEVQASIRFGF